MSHTIKIPNVLWDFYKELYEDEYPPATIRRVLHEYKWKLEYEQKRES